MLLAEEMGKKNVAKKHLAQPMCMRQARIDRILVQEKGNVMIEALQRAASLLGRGIHLELAREDTRVSWRLLTPH